MRKEKIIKELILVKDSSKSRTYISRVLNYSMLFTLCICFCLFFPVYRENTLNVYENSTYDYWVQCTTKDQVKQFENFSFVDSVFPFSLVTITLDKESKSMKQLALLTTSSFKNLETSSFVRENLIEEDETILDNAEKNPIVIDYALAKEEKLSVGDIYYIDTGLVKKPTAFTVGAIYQNHSEFSQFDAVVLCSKDINKFMYKIEKNMNYTMMYVKANDLQKLEKYLKTEFVPKLVYETTETQTGQGDISREEVSSYYQSREQKMKEEEGELDYTSQVIASIAVLGCIIFGVILFRENSKRIDNIIHDISILYALGLQKGKFQRMFLVDMFLTVIPSAMIALLVNKFIIYKYIAKSLFVTWNQIVKYGISIMLITVVTVTFVSFMLRLRINSEKVLSNIYGE